jgi:SAM-dependent methyltransferase
MSDEATWREMAPVWLDGAPARLWRTHSDAVNRALAERWLPGPLGDVLKTDLFDEAVADGILPALAPRADHLVGIDVEEAVRAVAAARLPDVEVVAADVRRLPFADATFDTVLSNSTLDHFATSGEIRLALAELGRVLRPGGRLLVTLDNPANPLVALSKALPRSRLNIAWARMGRSSARVGLAPYVVGATLSPRALRRALREAGLRPVASDAVVHAPRLVAVVVASRLERRTASRVNARFLDVLAACERLRGSPVAPLTAHFHAVLAVRPAAADDPRTPVARADWREGESSNRGSTMAFP